MILNIVDIINIVGVTNVVDIIRNIVNIRYLVIFLSFLSPSTDCRSASPTDVTMTILQSKRFLYFIVIGRKETVSFL